MVTCFALYFAHCKAMMWIDTRAMAVVGQRFADNSVLLSSDVIHFAEVTA